MMRDDLEVDLEQALTDQVKDQDLIDMTDLAQAKGDLQQVFEILEEETI